MRREELYLSDIIEASAAISNFIADKARDHFVQDDLLKSAVLQKLAIIGEAAARLPKEFQEKHAEIEWADIISFRNMVVHAYFNIDWDIVWITATKNVPELKEKVAKILKSL